MLFQRKLNIYTYTGVARQSESCRPVWWRGAWEKTWNRVQTDAFYSISEVTGTRNLVKFNLVLITLFMSNQVLWFYEE